MLFSLRCQYLNAPERSLVDPLEEASHLPQVLFRDPGSTLKEEEKREGHDERDQARSRRGH
jgi:hypothetical protein